MLCRGRWYGWIIHFIRGSQNTTSFKIKFTVAGIVSAIETFNCEVVNSGILVLTTTISYCNVLAHQICAATVCVYYLYSKYAPVRPVFCQFVCKFHIRNQISQFFDMIGQGEILITGIQLAAWDLRHASSTQSKSRNKQLVVNFDSTRCSIICIHSSPLIKSCIVTNMLRLGLTLNQHKAIMRKIAT